MKKILIVLAMAVLSAGCTKDFLSSAPSDQLSDANFWKTATDATEGVTAIYRQLQNGYQIYAFMPETDGMTPNAWIWSGYKNGYAAIAEGNLLPTTTTPVADKWNELYKGIYLANLALQKLPSVDMDQTLQQQLTGEALFLRALCYYNLADFYGGVPLVTGVLALGAPLPGRNTEDEVLGFVEAQCDTASQLLPPTYDAANVGRATRGAALTLKAKAQLLGKDYAGAAKTCTAVRDLKVYHLYNDYAGMFTSAAAENNAEVIFDVQYNAPALGQGSPQDGLMAPQSSFSKGWTQIYPTQDLVDSYEMTNGMAITDPGSGYDPAHPYDNRDPRMDYTVVRPGATWRGIPYDQIKVGSSASVYLGYLTRKYVLTVDGYNWGDSPLNYIVFRYADVLLMYAEAQNEAVGPDESVYEAINEVRARPGVNMPPIPAGKTQAEMREIIRHEDRVEFAMEGTYYSDIRRWGIAKQLMDGRVIKTLSGQQVDQWHFVDALYLWPVPQSEIDLNTQLTQNPGY